MFTLINTYYLKDVWNNDGDDLFFTKETYRFNDIIETKDTVRGTAKKYGVSKSTVHKDVSQRLLRINPLLASEVRVILDENKAERHIRGGLATKHKYEILHK